MFKRLIAALAVLVLAPAAAQAEARLALVVGVAEYGSQSLANPVRDAKLTSEALQAAGFQSVLLENPTNGALRSAVGDLAAKAKTAGKDTSVVFYFAGHGVRSDGENYLIPRGTTLFEGVPSTADFTDQALRAQWILDKLSESNVARILLVLDACRTSPVKDDRRARPEVGLTSLTPTPGGPDTLILFAAEPGMPAYDGQGLPDSYFTRALADAIRLPGLQLNEVIQAVDGRVRADTGGRQRPYIEGRLFPFTFVAGGASLASAMGLAPEKAQAAADPGELLREALKRRPIADIESAADNGDGFAMLLLGAAYWYGDGVQADPYRSRLMMKRALSRGVGRAAPILGMMACCAEPFAHDQREAEEWLRVGADLGVPVALRILGSRYRDGSGGLPQDAREAERLFVQAGKAGLPQAYADAAKLYSSPEYKQLDPAKAEMYLKLSTGERTGTGH